MFRRIIATTDDRVIALLRLTLGIVYFPHGAQKALGWFGGDGFASTIHFFTDMQHIPYVFGVLAIAAEFLGSIGLIVGFLGRIAAFGIACDILTAVYLVHYPNGFFMNWGGTQKGEGFEFHILAIAIALVIMIRGSGAFSVDHALTEREFRAPVL